MKAYAIAFILGAAGGGTLVAVFLGVFRQRVVAELQAVEAGLHGKLDKVLAKIPR